VRRKIKRLLRLKRNTQAAFNEIHNRCHSVATDSVNGSEPNSAKLSTVVSSLRNGLLTVTMKWEIINSPDMLVAGIPFRLFHRQSHKYWLRELVRRCR
jgi:hypothetical protein